ncbi:hypothetical protein [Peribacillus loiseleuriae]|uniref:Uncharacterized protein n=1 Tax=Peribacillus loiseleuriae TaxID=1679170 RepID=A0A0K9GSR2_9BACI|nr:hypothetical protein [Peribacillus loiseleuriae]KMY49651.1 hypothetical protein AC625_08950 [Peribacillus loiseleuriae]
MKDAREKLLWVIENAQEAIKHIDNNAKRLAVGKIDEIEFDSTESKWILINKVIDEEGKL